MSYRFCFDNFERLIHTPEDVDKLNKFILQLAVQGKLVEQGPNDEPASKLLERIKAEKKEYIEENKIRISKKFTSAMFKEAFPHSIPPNWEFVNLDDVINFITDFQANGSFATLKANVTYYSEPNYAVLVRLLDLRKNMRNVSNFKYTDEHGYHFLKKSSLFGGEVLVANVGAGVGTSILMPRMEKKATLAPNMFKIVVSSLVNEKYFMFFSKSNNFWNDLNKVSSGTGQPKINKTQYRSIRIPLPPLNEQKRIVARIESLFEKTKALKEKLEKADKQIVTLNKSALNHVFSSSGNQQYKFNLNFLFDKFNLLYSDERNVKELKQAILQLAVMGKLVRQDPNDEPASKLLERIKAEKEQLIKDKKIKKSKESGEIEENLIENIIPSTWKSAKIVDLCFVTKLAGFEYTKYINLTNTGEVPVIRAQNVRMNRIYDRNLLYIDLETSNLLARSALTKKAILMTFIGAGIGDVAIFNKNERWHLAPNVAKLEPFNNYEEKIKTTFLLYYLMSPLGKSEIFRFSKATAQPSLSMGTIRQVVVPLPPLTEQKRIVEKVDKLMAFCDELGKGILGMNECREKLSGVVLR